MVFGPPSRHHSLLQGVHCYLRRAKKKVAGYSQHMTSLLAARRATVADSSVSSIVYMGSPQHRLTTVIMPTPSMSQQNQVQENIYANLNEVNMCTEVQDKPDRHTKGAVCITEKGPSTDQYCDRSSKVALQPMSWSAADTLSLPPMGQLQLEAYTNCGLLTSHIQKGRQLHTESCITYVSMCLITGSYTASPTCTTEACYDTTNPVYDEKFSFELGENDCDKRLLISVWRRHLGQNLLIGCMSFGVSHLVEKTRVVSGWYLLLPGSVGRRKHLPVRMTSQKSEQIPDINKDLCGMSSVKVVMWPSQGGYGFTIAGYSPVTISKVETGSPAQKAGLMYGDAIVKIHGHNISRSSTDSVAKIVKRSHKLVLDVYRVDIVYEKSHTMRLPISGSYWAELPLQQPSKQCAGIRQGGADLQCCDYVKLTHGILPDESLPLSEDGEVDRQMALQLLMCAESRFITCMHTGLQLYSCPLRHYIITASQHNTLFQNIEKLVTISEYHVTQMSVCNDAGGCQPTADMGQVYEPQILLLTAAYESYCSGLDDALCLLTYLQQCDHFHHFMQPIHSGALSLASFLYTPVDHLRQLMSQMSVILSHTPHTSHVYPSLHRVTQGNFLLLNLNFLFSGLVFTENIAYSHSNFEIL